MKLAKIIRNNLGLILFLIGIVTLFTYWANSVQTFNNNLEQCGANYCTR